MKRLKKKEKDDKCIKVLIEIPYGSRAKYEYEDLTDKLVLDRVLPGSMVYPFNYGFIPETLAKDGDPLDVIFLSSEPVFPGSFVFGRVVSALKVIDDNEVDDKIVMVACNDPLLEEIKDLAVNLKRRMEEFFSGYKVLEGKKVQVTG